MSPTVPALGPDFSGFSVNSHAILSGIFVLIFLWWLVFTLVSIYHWLRHARESFVAVPVVVLHLFVSGALIFYATSGLH